MFYALGSLFLILGVVVMIAFLVLIWKTYQALQRTQQQIVDFKDNVTARVSDFASAKSSMIANTMAMGVATFIAKKVMNIFRKNETA